MKKGFVTAFLVLIVVLATSAMIYSYMFPSYSYRYRLTVTVELDGQIHSGSSVVEVRWRGQPKIGDIGNFTPALRGQAALIDLGAVGVVVAALGTGSGYGRARDGALGALWLVPAAFGISTSANELANFLPLQGSRELSTENFPRLLWLRDSQQPQTVKVIYPTDIARELGANSASIRTSVKMTSDPIAIDIDKKLPWLVPLRNTHPDPELILTRGGVAITHYMFIGDAS